MLGEKLGVIKNALSDLNDREQRFLSMRHGLDGSKPKTLEEISVIEGLTRERVRQIQNMALRKLRNSDEIQDLV